MRQKIVMTKSQRNLEEKYGKALKSCNCSSGHLFYCCPSVNN